jgi:hypothetical protein
VQLDRLAAWLPDYIADKEDIHDAFIQMEVYGAIKVAPLLRESALAGHNVAARLMTP